MSSIRSRSRALLFRSHVSERTASKESVDDNSDEDIDAIAPIANKRYVFDSNSDHLLLYICYGLGTESLSAFTNMPSKENPIEYMPCFAHYLVTFGLIGLPILYMEMAIGQYTRHGVLHFGKLIPLAHGLGWSMLLVALYQGMFRIRLLANCIMYLAMSISTLPFAYCFRGDHVQIPELEDKICADLTFVSRCHGELADAACEDSSLLILPAEVFYRTYVVNGKKVDWTAGLGTISAGTAVSLLLAWSIVCVVCLLKMSGLRKWLRVNVLLIIVFKIVLLVVVVGLSTSYSDSYTNINKLFVVHPESLISLKTWIKAMNTTLFLVAVGNAGHTLFGSYCRPTTASDLQAIFLIIVHFVTLLISALFCHILEDYLHSRMGIATAVAAIDQLMFIDLPQALSLMPVPQLWCILYFLMLVLLGINLQVIGVTAIVETITDFLPKIAPFRVYVVALIGVVSFLVSLLMATPGGLALFYFMEDNLMMKFRYVLLVVQVVCVNYLYGTQRFADDIHFMLGAQPPLFWKICWLAMPVVLCVFFIQDQVDNSHVKESSSVSHAILAVNYTWYLLPIVVGAVYKCFKFLQAHNVAGVLKPEKTWGPPESRERLMRRIYNPRRETRSRRRNQACKHRCLHGSTVLAEVLARERRARAALLSEEAS